MTKLGLKTIVSLVFCFSVLVSNTTFAAKKYKFDFQEALESYLATAEHKDDTE